jgi:glycine cleavage system H protein
MKRENEWIKIEKNIITVGISSYAAKEIGEILFIELPKVGRKVKKGEEVCILESNKAAFDVYAPISGKIVEVNEKLKKNLKDLNKYPESKGWLFKIESSNLKELEEC